MEDSQDLSEQSVSTKAAKVNGKKKNECCSIYVWRGFTSDLRITVRSRKNF